jgi:hypothetical protein
MRQQFADPVVGMLEQALQHVPEVGPRIVSVELG